RRRGSDRDGQPQPVPRGLGAAARSGREPRVGARGVAVRLEGTKSFDAPQSLVWEVLNDPERMAQAMPGVESFSVQDDRHWQANVKVPLGMGALRMSMKFEKTEERPPDFAALHAKGTG